MKISIKKFGTRLISRPAGREALLIIQQNFIPKSENESLDLDFAGVEIVAPSWLDEVYSGLKSILGDRVNILVTTNTTLEKSMEVLGIRYTKKLP